MKFYDSMRRRPLFAAGFACAILVLLCLNGSSAFACSLRSKPLTKFDDSEYIFIGTVVGYTDPIEIPGRANTNDGRGGEPGDWYRAQGLRVKVKQAINVPEPKGDTFEVFEYFYSGVCQPIGLIESILQDRAPVGKDVLVIGRRARVLPSGVDTTRLEEAPAGGLILSFKYLAPDLYPTAESIADYQKLALDEKSRGVIYSLLRFESRKDLLRLQNAPDLETKRQLLNHLLYLPDLFRRLDIFTIIQNNIPDKAEAKELYLIALHAAGYPQKTIDIHLKCLEKQIKTNSIVPGEFRC